MIPQRNTDPHSRHRLSWSFESGMTMIEIAVVIALVAFLYGIAVPQFSLRTGAEAATKVQRVADDIRSAFDMAVLNNKTYRIAFEMATGDYYLEEADGPVTQLSEEKLGRDPTAEEVKNKDLEFATQTKEYQNLIGEEIKDDDGKPIDGSNSSPIMKNRDAAKGPKWSKVENLEWQGRTLGPYLLISELQAEHHEQKQVLYDLGENARAFIYFFPMGYVEKSYIRVAFKKDKMVVDEEQKPYTIVTRPFLGTTQVIAGVAEIDVHDLKEESEQI